MDGRQITKVIVEAGICGFTATIEVLKLSPRSVKVNITSECEMVTKMGESLAELRLRDALRPQVDSEVYKCASECGLHAACPVPMAILKAIEVEAGLALPQAVLVRFETTELG
jgi:hypothetical protein